MKLRASIVLFYGILLLVGGFIGFLKAGSIASLIMGGISAVLAISSAVSMFKNRAIGSVAAIALSVILSIFFSYRYSLTLTFMPSGLMAVLSLLVVGTLVLTKKTAVYNKKKI